MRLKPLPRSRVRRGATMAETSIVLSVFFVIVLGVIEMSQLGMASQVLTTAASAGCRIAVIDGHTQSDVTSTIAGILSSSGIPSNKYTVTTEPSDVTTSKLGDSVKVTITLPFSGISWIGTPKFMGSTTLTAAATLSSERP